MIMQQETEECTRRTPHIHSSPLPSTHRPQTQQGPSSKGHRGCICTDTDVFNAATQRPLLPAKGQATQVWLDISSETPRSMPGSPSALDQDCHHLSIMGGGVKESHSLWCDTADARHIEMAKGFVPSSAQDIQRCRPEASCIVQAGRLCCARANAPAVAIIADAIPVVVVSAGSIAGADTVASTASAIACIVAARTIAAARHRVARLIRAASPPSCCPADTPAPRQVFVRC